MNLKTQLYNHIMRLFRLNQLDAPQLLIDKETATIEDLKGRINKNRTRYKTDVASIEEIELLVKRKIESIIGA